MVYLLRIVGRTGAGRIGKGQKKSPAAPGILITVNGSIGLVHVLALIKLNALNIHGLLCVKTCTCADAVYT